MKHIKLYEEFVNEAATLKDVKDFSGSKDKILVGLKTNLLRDMLDRYEYMSRGEEIHFFDKGKHFGTLFNKGTRFQELKHDGSLDDKGWLNKIKTNPKAVLFEVSQNSEAQMLTLRVNPKMATKAESIVNKFQLSDYSGPILKRGWTAKQVQGAINPGDIVKQEQGKGVWNFYRLAKVDTKVKNV